MNRLKHKTRLRTGVTIVELVVAVAVMALVATAMVPLFGGIRNSWAGRQAGVDVLENGRALMEHMSRNLSQATQVTNVSSASQTSGYIEYQDNSGSTLRYQVGPNSYVQFGPIGGPSDLAGPVSELTFTCYSASDFSTPITTAASIRFIKISATFTSSSSLSRSQTFTASVYLRTNGTSSGGLGGWWKLDETSGLTAADSSGSGNNGTLVNMTGNEWISTGAIGRALPFNGTDDYVSLPIGSLIGSMTGCTIAMWVNWSGQGSTCQRIFDFGSSTSINMYLTPNNGNTGTPFFAITVSGYTNEDRTIAPQALSAGAWHHIAVTIDPTHTTHSLYIDGQSVAQNTSARYKPSSLGATTNNWLGRSQYSWDPYFQGSLDDVRIYRSVLDAQTIAQLANPLTYKGFTEAKAASITTSITIPTPTTNVGDLLIAAVAADGDTSASMTAPSGQGWTLIDSGAYNGAVTLAAWWKVAGSSEPASHRFTWSTFSGPYPGQAYGWMMRFTGQDATNPINTYSTSGESSATPTSPAVTTTVPNCLILRLGGFDDDGIVVDSPGLAGHTAITMDKSASSSGGATYQSYSETKVHPGNTSITFSKPSGTTQGDLLVAAVGTNGYTPNSMAPPSGQGWSSLTVAGPPNWVVTLGIYYKQAGASEPSSYKFTWTGSMDAYGLMMRFTGGTPSVVGFGPTWDTSSSPNCASVTPSGPFGGSLLVLRLGCFDNSDLSGSGQLPGETLIRSGNAHGCAGAAGYKIIPAGTPTGSNRFSLNSSDAYQTATIPIWAGVYAGTVSGGAGYVGQPATGGSGTSTFSLTAANEARMLTIAIAPNAAYTGSAGSQVLP